jgi:broad specificity phosphatase PhoE
MVTKLILVRHGETVENKAGITQGHFNSQLNDNGKEQVKAVALHLKDEKIEVCYSSDLDRCMNTAKEIIKYHPEVKIISTKQLREQTKGKYEGAKREITHAAIKQLTTPYVEWDYDGAESFIDMNNRTMKEIYKIVKENKDKTVLIVAHGGQIASVICTINNDDIYNRQHRGSNNCAITVIEFDGSEKGTIKEFNNTKHLSSEK